MMKTLIKLFLSVLPLTYMASCGTEMPNMIQKMDSAEKTRNVAVSNEVVAFMSLDVMFPDVQVRALAKAAGDGNIKKIEQLVKEGVSVNSKGTQGATPLFWGLRNYEGFKRLLELGADPNVVFGNGDGGSVMHWAVTAKDNRLLSELLQHGGNPNLIDNESGYTPLFSALPVGVRAVKVLLDAGAEINARDRFGNTPAIAAAGRGRFEIVYELLQRGADYSVKDRAGHDLADEVASVAGLLKPESESAKWLAKVSEWLQAKGVEIPVKPNG